MKIVHDLQSNFVLPGPVVFCLGVFDGVHAGHQHLISQAKQLSASVSGLVLLSFKNAPKSALCGRGNYRINTLAHKELLLAALGVDILLHISFTDVIQNLSAEQFLEFLNAKVPISHYVICNDVAFGKNRTGNLAYLYQEASIRGQAVFCSEKMRGISSTDVRMAIQAGKLDEVSLMLKRPYSIYGSLLQQTSNIWSLEDTSLCLPPDGIYNATVQSLMNMAMPTQVIIQDKRLHLEVPFMHTQERFLEIVFST
jgi:riboflavin kinase / FMN adenylyltransferase